MTGKQILNGEKMKTSNTSNPPSKSTKMPHMVTRLAISDLNQHLTCALCSGYMIDATTVVECLHSFCRSCLLRYLESTNTCPICDTQIIKGQLDKFVRADHTLQDLVYKLVPGLYKSELRRRKDFYLEQCKSASDDASTSTSTKSESMVNGGMQIFDKHLVDLSAFICTPDEIISFSLETTPKKSIQQIEGMGKKEINSASASTSTSSSSSTQEKAIDKNGSKAEELHFKRYFRCPAAVTVGHLKKLLAYKMDLSSAHQIEILHSDESLLEEYTLMDIAYIYTWRRKAPMQLFFNICKYEFEEEPMPLLMPEIAAASTSTTTTSAPSTPAVPPIVATSLLSTCYHQDFKKDFTIKPRSNDSTTTILISSGGSSKKSDSKNDHQITNGENNRLSKINVENSTNAAKDVQTRRQEDEIRTVLKTACRPYKSPPTSEISMRGKPPLPLHPDHFNGFNSSSSKSTPISNHNGRMPPIRLALKKSGGEGKKKVKPEGDAPSKPPKTPKQPKPRKSKLKSDFSSPVPSTTSPTILDALHKISAYAPMSIPSQQPPSIVEKSNIPISSPINISIDNEKKFHSPNSLIVREDHFDSSPDMDTTDEGEGLPLLSPSSGAYKPTAAQSACNQPAKLRLKKSLNSIVEGLSSQKLSTDTSDGCSNEKKMKFENGSSGDEHLAPTLAIH